MKILMLADSLGLGGVETHIELLQRKLSEMGCVVVVGSSGGEIAKRMIKNKENHILLPSFDSKIDKNTPPFLDVLIAQRALYRAVRKLRPDIVHAHTRKTAFLAYFICRHESIPLVVSAHAKLSMSNIIKLLTVWGDGTIAVCEDIKSHIKENSIIKPRLITVIRNGV